MSAQLRTLIVDDEPVARRILREELETMEGIEIVGEAEDGEAALERIREDHPDLVLLDLQMPVMGGLDAVRRLKGGSRLPAVVIVTAWDQHAIQAFEAGAIDYLLKPVSRERLLEAVDRARQTSGQEAVERVARTQELAEPQNDRHTRRIVGRSGTEYILMNATRSMRSRQREIWSG
jgi:two-component system LytT family response regulator